MLFIMRRILANPSPDQILESLQQQIEDVLTAIPQISVNRRQIKFKHNPSLGSSNIPWSVHFKIYGIIHHYAASYLISLNHRDYLSPNKAPFNPIKLQHYSVNTLLKNIDKIYAHFKTEIDRLISSDFNQSRLTSNLSTLKATFFAQLKAEIAKYGYTDHDLELVHASMVSMIQTKAISSKQLIRLPYNGDAQIDFTITPVFRLSSEQNCALDNASFTNPVQSQLWNKFKNQRTQLVRGHFGARRWPIGCDNLYTREVNIETTGSRTIIQNTTLVTASPMSPHLSHLPWQTRVDLTTQNIGQWLQPNNKMRIGNQYDVNVEELAYKDDESDDEEKTAHIGDEEKEYNTLAPYPHPQSLNPKSNQKTIVLFLGSPLPPLLSCIQSVLSSDKNDTPLYKLLAEAITTINKKPAEKTQILLGVTPANQIAGALSFDNIDAITTYFARKSQEVNTVSNESTPLLPSRNTSTTGQPKERHYSITKEHPKRQKIQHLLATLAKVRTHPELAHFIPILIKQMTNISGDHFIAFCKSSKDRYYGFDMLFIAITTYNQIHRCDIISTITEELNSLKSGQKYNKYQAQTQALNDLLNRLINADIATNLRLALLGIAQSAGPKIPAPSFLPGQRRIQILSQLVFQSCLGNNKLMKMLGLLSLNIPTGCMVQHLYQERSWALTGISSGLLLSQTLLCIHQLMQNNMPAGLNKALLFNTLAYLGASTYLIINHTDDLKFTVIPMIYSLLYTLCCNKSAATLLCKQPLTPAYTLLHKRKPYLPRPKKLLHLTVALTATIAIRNLLSLNSNSIPDHLKWVIAISTGILVGAITYKIDQQCIQQKLLALPK